MDKLQQELEPELVGFECMRRRKACSQWCCASLMHIDWAAKPTQHIEIAEQGHWSRFRRSGRHCGALHNANGGLLRPVLLVAHMPPPICITSGDTEQVAVASFSECAGAIMQALLRTPNTEEVGSANQFGDKQLKVCASECSSNNRCWSGGYTPLQSSALQRSALLEVAASCLLLADTQADVAADRIVFDALRSCGAVARASSEETTDLQDLGGTSYSVGDACVCPCPRMFDEPSTVLSQGAFVRHRCRLIRWMAAASSGPTGR